MNFIKSSESSVMSAGGNESPSVEGVALKLNLDGAGGRGKGGHSRLEEGLEQRCLPLCPIGDNHTTGRITWLLQITGERARVTQPTRNPTHLLTNDPSQRPEK